MKIIMKNSMLFILVLFTAKSLHGEDSDKWQTLRDHNMLMRGEDVYTDTNLARYDAKNLIKTKINYSTDLALLKRTRDWRECLPVKDFPQGNWGLETNSAQVSLRFEKPSYTNGEAFHAIVLIRNCGTNELLYFDPFYFNHDPYYTSVNYFVFDESNRPVIPKPLKQPGFSIGSLGGGMETLEPNTQRKILMI